MSSRSAEPRKDGRPWSITARLTLLNIVSASVLLLSIGFYLHHSLADALAQDNRQFLLKEIQLLRSVLREQPPNLAHLADEQSEGIDLPVGSYYSRILDVGGHSLIETPGMESLPAAPQFPAPGEPPEASAATRELTDGRTVMLMTAWSEAGRPAAPRLSIQIALDVSHEAALLAAYRRKLAGALSLGLLFSSLAAVFMVRQGLRPLAEITRHMEGINAARLHQRLEPAQWPQELSTLASAFDGMLLRLADAFARLTQFSADLAHELRTPINNLMGETEVALSRPRGADEYRQILESNLEEYARLSRTVKSLLFLARAENTEIPLRTARLDGRAQLEAVRSYHEALAEETGVRLVCQGQGDLHADGPLLKRAVSNLVINALRHTPAGGEIRMSLHPADDGSVEIRVQDNGRGIAAEHLPKLFDRFYRVDPARSEEGTGLGLAIVKSIMDLHGGKVEITSHPGAGTTVSLKFPLSAAHAPLPTDQPVR